MLRKTVLVSTVCALVLLFLSQLGLGRAEANTTSPIGSWQFSLIPAAGTPRAQPIPGLITFISDGTVVEDDLGELGGAPSSTERSTLRSTSGHGIWQPSPAVGNLFVQIISLVANPDGSLRAKKTLSMTIALNATGDKFRGGFSLELQDPTGHALAMTSGSCAGQLIPHPLLP